MAAHDQSELDSAVSRYLHESRAERRFRHLLERGRRPSRRLALAAAGERNNRAAAFLADRDAKLIGRAFTSIGPFYPSTALGAPVLVYQAPNPASATYSEHSFWLLAETGDLHPDPSDRRFGLSPVELVAEMERGEFHAVDDVVRTRVTAFANEQQQAIDADPTAPKKLGVTRVDGASLLTQPDPASDVVASLPKGALVVVFEVAGAWARVRSTTTPLATALTAPDEPVEGWLSIDAFVS